MKILLSTAIAAFVLTRSVAAGEVAAPAPAATGNAAAAETESKAALPRYELKNKSSFALAAGTRPPFWPIGWVKRKSGAPVEVANTGAAKQTFDAKNFNVTSILLGPPALAVVNGRAYEEGQFLRTPRGAGALKGVAAAPRVRVYRITDGQVWLQWEDQIINVTLKRPELSERKIEEELLNEERDEEFAAPAVSKR